LKLLKHIPKECFSDGKMPTQNALSMNWGRETHRARSSTRNEAKFPRISFFAP